MSKEEFFSHKESCGIKNIDHSKEKEQEPLNIASFTFGGRHSEGLKDMIIETTSFNQSFKARKMSEETLNDDNARLNAVGIVNKLGQHNSFVSCILQLIWNMKGFRNYILNDMIVAEDNKFKFLSNLRVSFMFIILVFL